ncbi:MAG: DUF3160 domain-containing protein [Coleofasciculus sp. B1-GNL1-01]|uniref:DUF3160 domain-containing protein n=1 Tax=Coleofasciculus sp. B1-GNL1-01 TaxID=3068484 RepID=UPI0032F92149
MKRVNKLWIRACRIVAATCPMLSLMVITPNVAWSSMVKLDISPQDATVTTVAQNTSPTGSLGYTRQFNQELQQIGQISPQAFKQRYASKAEYLPQISWDVTTAKFWDDFNLSPEEIANRYRDYMIPIQPRDDFRLNAEELAVFQRNGFVVSERMSAPSFAAVFYNIYSRDLPVFVSSDALLHAWHRSYDAMLEELEAEYLARSLDEILAGMAQRLPQVRREYGKGVLEESILDADYFIAVARSLLSGNRVRSYFNQNSRVAETLDAIESGQLQEFTLFGRDRSVDFSQFKPRGHYEKSEALKKYFRAMIWCGRIDLRIAGNPEESSPRELGIAIILNHLLNQSGKFSQWQQFDQMLQTFVGQTDSMTFAELNDFLVQNTIKSPTEIKTLSTLEQLQTDILATPLGLQSIRGDSYQSPPDSEQIQLPRSFTLLGQKFVLDSWVLSKVVYDDILWDGKKVPRRIPSSLDVAFAALGNNQIVPELVDRMTTRGGRQFRDGLNYQHHLAAVKTVVDQQNPAIWEQNIYLNWLATLRELSTPTTEAKYPEAMRTKAWAMKTLNTQLASWTQLRHDTILYAKQSYTGGTRCFYPAGFVEPRPEFWGRFEKMVQLAAQQINRTRFPDSSRQIQERQVKFLENFAEKVAILKDIATKELAQQELSQEQTRFLRNIVEIDGGSGGPYYRGWYPSLFYEEPKDSNSWDAIVADVHTDVPDPVFGDPGAVLHQGVGNVDLLMIAVDNGEDKMVYAGPVLSHYEFEMPGVVRKSDSEWQNDIKEGNVPPRPQWTEGYLVPGIEERQSRF